MVAQNRDLVGNDSDCKTSKPARYNKRHAINPRRQSSFAGYRHRKATALKCQGPACKTLFVHPNSSWHGNIFQSQGQGQLERSDKAVSYEHLRDLEEQASLDFQMQSSAMVRCALSTKPIGEFIKGSQARPRYPRRLSSSDRTASLDHSSGPW